MQATLERRRLGKQFFDTLLEASFPLQAGPDREVTLEALLDATDMLREHLERELEEIRVEQVE